MFNVKIDQNLDCQKKDEKTKKNGKISSVPYNDNIILNFHLVIEQVRAKKYGLRLFDHRIHFPVSASSSRLSQKIGTA